MTVTATNPFGNISGISTSTGSTSASGVPTSSGSSPISVSGLVSGINASAIINALVAANGASTDVLKGEMNNKQVQVNALADYNTKVLQAQLDLAPLQTPATFQTWQATTSNPAALSATSAGGSAVPGTYELNVLQVAQAEQLGHRRAILGHRRGGLRHHPAAGRQWTGDLARLQLRRQPERHRHRDQQRQHRHHRLGGE